MVLRKLKIGSRLAVGFGAIILLLVGTALGAVVLDKIGRDKLSESLASAGAKEQLAVEMKLLALEQSRALRNLVLIADPKTMQAENERIKSLAVSLDRARERIVGMALTPAERQVVDNVAKIDAEFDEPVKTAFDYASVFRTEDTGNLLLKTIDPLVQRQLEELDTLVQLQRGAYLEALENSRSAGERLLWTTFAVVAVALAV